jgi:hypothetical protein
MLMSGRKGFMAVEILPAMLLLLGILVILFRILWIQMEMNLSSMGILRKTSAFAAAWEEWETSDGRIAFTVPEELSGWRVIYFPDETWLPPLVSVEYAFMWRRKRVESGSLTGFWEVETLNMESGNWIWWATITSLEP